jgi:citrate lyase beta subunit
MALDEAVTAPVLEALARAEAASPARLRGDPARRGQPVSVLYGGAHLFARDTPRKLGELARRAFATYAPDPETFGAALGIAPPLRAEVHARVAGKLARAPVEDLRIDFEDGYGLRPDDEEDRHATAAAEALAEVESTPGIRYGIRIKALESGSAERAIRTLDLFLATLGGRRPARFSVTLPKVTAAAQVAALADLLDALEARHPASRAPEPVAIELMVEDLGALHDAEGRLDLPRWIEAGRGRVRGAHLGTYDLTASAGVVAAHQRPDHPVADYARLIMLASLAGRGIELSDGATTTLPIGPHRGRDLDARAEAENRAVVHDAWRRHHDDVKRALAFGLPQGWDLHPAQLVSRYAAVHAFVLEALPASTARLSSFLAQAARATRVGAVFDDAATGQGLLNFFLRALSCGAIGPAEVEAAGLSVDELATGSFAAIVTKRR